MRWGGKPLKNGRKHEISGEKQRKKEILTNLLFGASVHNETTQNTLLYGIQNIF